MKRRAPITQGELRAIRKSVDRAWKRLVRKYSRGAKTSHVADEERLLKAVRAGECGLTEPFGRSVIKRALINDDSVFFIRMGRALESLPPFSQIKIPLPKRIETFIVSHWAEAKDGFPELFALTPDDLTVVLIQVTGDETLQTEAVVKMRQRLGLKAFPRKQYSVIWRDGKICFRRVDK